MPLVINSLRGGHIHTHANTHIHIQMIHAGSILRNQACAWFKDQLLIINPLTCIKLLKIERKCAISTLTSSAIHMPKDYKLKNIYEMKAYETSFNLV